MPVRTTSSGYGVTDQYLVQYISRYARPPDADSLRVMQPAERDQDPTPTIVGSTEEGPALRDATATAERAARDEAEAADARDRFRQSPIPTIAPDEAIAVRLEPGEGLHSARRSAFLSVPGGDRALG